MKLPGFSSLDELLDAFVPRTIELLHREYPNAPQLRPRGDEDVRPPREVHPAFFGCYDWHSAVHSHWQVVRALRFRTEAAWEASAREALERSFSPTAIARESAYLDHWPNFEMPYGMAWLLQLAAELREWDDEAARRWSETLTPLEQHAAAAFERQLAKLPRPVRTGLHNQTAFALGLAHDWARLTGHELASTVARRARELYLGDRDCPVAYEPSGSDFLSPGLAEADLLRRVLPSAELATWLEGFFGPGGERLAGLTPVEVVDPSDGQLAHYSGLNMSRAWMLRGVADALPDEHAMRSVLESSAEQHLAEGLGAALHDDYMVSHWAPSFVVYLVTERAPSGRR
ncbi:MAG: DUF2891 domain-containing protein [Acidobacteriota bacterium]